jgi:hypothetical protein
MQGLMDTGGKSDVIAIQEPWIGDKNRKKKTKGAVEVGGGKITVGHQGYDIIFQGGTENARVMWMVRKDAGLKYEIRNDIWKDPDASVMDVKLKEGTLRIVNVYN